VHRLEIKVLKSTDTSGPLKKQIMILLTHLSGSTSSDFVQEAITYNKCPFFSSDLFILPGWIIARTFHVTISIFVSFSLQLCPGSDPSRQCDYEFSFIVFWTKLFWRDWATNNPVLNHQPGEI